MKCSWIITLLVLAGITAQSQKKPVEQQGYDWVRLPDGYSLSNDGRFVAYGLPDLAVVASVEGNWERKLPGMAARDVVFLADNKKALWRGKGDSLTIQRLGGEGTAYIPGVIACKTSGVGEWTAFQGRDSVLTLQNLAGNQKWSYRAVRDFQFTQDGSALIYGSGAGLYEVTVPTGKARQIWQGTGYSQLLVDRSGTHIAFIAGKNIGYWKTGMAQATLYPVDAADQPLGFGLDGRQVFFNQKAPKEPPLPAASGVMVPMDVWTYKDVVLPPNQGFHDRPDAFPAVLNLDGGRVVALGEPGEHLSGSPTGGVALISSEPGENLERYWNPGSMTSVRLVSTLDGRVLHEFKAKAFFNFVELSKDGRYVLYPDYTTNNFWSYAVATGQSVNITESLPDSPIELDNEMPAQPSWFYGTAGWLENDKAVLVYDKYDLWELDPTGKAAPVNVTNGYGRRRRIRFRIANTHGSDFLLAALDDKTKNNGFYRKRIGAPGDPTPVLAPEAAFYYFPGSFIGEPGVPVKARDAEVYLLTRQTADYAPNLCVLEANGKVKRLTDLQPQKDFQWMTSELVDWTMYNGKDSKGILYKPEDFDPNRKYPLIFYYYRTFSNGVHQFIYPQMSVMLNIPYYTSHGYLVFIPDIHYTLGEPEHDVYNAVVSAADYLGRLPYVDSAKLGISGHSFGGYETNCLVATSTKFAAASEGAGASDLVSTFGEGSLQMMYCERGAYDLGETLWNRPAMYIRNSPVFSVNKVTTPLLIMHNRDDNNVPFDQGLEFFMSLRRLDKPVWLLQYAGEGHTLGDGPATDFSLRQAQFFNHYLKGETAPGWMKL